ncbi:hypothetical protein IJ22_18060 [Paenibacillus naphthalenovorans]|uniref:Uncharacterized protein n=1 Tax=Paenibacillus naphthalenovorans TaxID=162209 RepID=A0A0U2W0X4_9BACL|nr:hypothetical protein IJ22_18060 [Paenibacillus naphthalenovorans]
MLPEHEIKYRVYYKDKTNNVAWYSDDSDYELAEKRYEYKINNDEYYDVKLVKETINRTVLREQ